MEPAHRLGARTNGLGTPSPELPQSALHESCCDRPAAISLPSAMESSTRKARVLRRDPRAGTHGMRRHGIVIAFSTAAARTASVIRPAGNLPPFARVAATQISITSSRSSATAFWMYSTRRRRRLACRRRALRRLRAHAKFIAGAVIANSHNWASSSLFPLPSTTFSTNLRFSLVIIRRCSETQGSRVPSGLT